MSKPTMTVTEDRTAEIMQVIKSFKRDAVLVGIPQGDSERQDDDISNAALLFINNFGSPLNNIPPRPVMEIGIRAAQDKIADEYKKAIGAAWKKGLPALAIANERVGMIASNSVKRTINDQIGIDAPADATIEAREKAGFNGTKALVVTGQMRNAITYIVQPGGF